MKRRKHNASQCSLFEPTIRVSDLPLDVRQKLVDQLGQLLVQASQSMSEQDTQTSTTRQEASHT